MAENKSIPADFTGYKIFGEKCGRDENGAFHCVCGRCRPIRHLEIDTLSRRIRLNGTPIESMVTACEVKWDTPGLPARVKISLIADVTINTDGEITIEKILEEQAKK